MLAVVLLAGRSVSTHLFVATAVVAAAITGLAIGVETAKLLIERARRLPLVTRNLPIGDVRLPKPLPALVLDFKGGDALAPAIAALGLAISIHHNGSNPAAITGLSVAVAVIAAPAVLLVVQLMMLVRRQPAHPAHRGRDGRGGLARA